MISRLDNTNDKIDQSANEQKVILQELAISLQDTREHIVTTVKNTLSLEYIRDIGSSLQEFLRGIALTTFATYRLVQDIHGRLPSQLERSTYQAPFELEDACGRVMHISQYTIDSWPAFENWLNFRFRDMEGQVKVRSGRYVLHHRASNTDVSKTSQNVWEKAFLPGQRIVMCMTFLGAASNMQNCPRCQILEPGMDQEIEW